MVLSMSHGQLCDVATHCTCMSCMSNCSELAYLASLSNTYCGTLANSLTLFTSEERQQIGKTEVEMELQVTSCDCFTDR